MKRLSIVIIVIFLNLSGYSQPIFDAIQNNDIQQIEKLSKKKKLLDTISIKYGTPLMAAVSLGNNEIVKLLILNGVEINEEVSIWFFHDYKRCNASRRGKSQRRGYSSAIDIAVEKGNYEILNRK